MTCLVKVPVFYVYRMAIMCNVRSCDARRMSAVITKPGAYDEDDFLRAAQAEGWTFWGSRSFLAYCPEHGPRPGHRMYQIDYSGPRSRIVLTRERP